MFKLDHSVIITVLILLQLNIDSPHIIICEKEKYDFSQTLFCGCFSCVCMHGKESITHALYCMYKSLMSFKCFHILDFLTILLIFSFIFLLDVMCMLKGVSGTLLLVN